ncbi:hypothetical protein Clacol_002359 [Clathrus columnatus]|uniref:Non-hemolytic phospholipase C n=1 Tax=Clathrus columnatus TaxID=1419009 RepID=A0AAV5A6G6_9AGAM|nr:hypothetical protein Clacol_002359 [Clathrus columnatus]
MAGVRGFADPNAHVSENGKQVWFQLVDGTLSNDTEALLPFYINAAGGNLTQATQCMLAGSNGFTANHAALAQGDNNLWAIANTPYSWGYFLRQDIPTHFALAEGWTVADMYAQAAIATTHPNRAFWVSGSINVPGGPQQLDQGGVAIDNNETPGCEAPNLDCYPYSWKTTAEFYEEAGVSWQLYQGTDNFGDNPFAWFEQFQNAPANSTLAERAFAVLGLQAFYDAAANGTLPQISYIIGPGGLSEHPPWSPSDGAWLHQQVVNAVINSPKYSSTVLMVSYDETGGWGDHVIPITAPKDTPGEWMTNPFNTSQTVFAGPGFRLPFYVVSPWTRGGHVFTAHSDHSSQIMFIEEWLASKGKNVVTDQLNPWRREHMSNLLQMFDFEHPDMSIPDLPVPTPPAIGPQGQFLGDVECQTIFPNPQPPVPYGQQTRQNSLTIETGFKSVRGSLTEGRFLVFESGNSALSLDTRNRQLTLGGAVPEHDTPLNRFVLHATANPPATTFNLQFFETINGQTNFIGSNLKATTSMDDAAVFDITDLGNSKGYTIQEVSSGQFLTISGNGKSLALGRQATPFNNSHMGSNNAAKRHPDLVDRALPPIPGHIALGHGWEWIWKHRLFSSRGNEDVVNFEVLTRRNQFLKFREIYQAVRTFGDNLITVEKDAWKRHRKVIAPSFSESTYKVTWDEAIKVMSGLFNEKWGKDTEYIIVKHMPDLTSLITLKTISAAGKIRNILAHEATNVIELYMKEMIAERRNKQEERHDLFNALLVSNEENWDNMNDKFTDEELICWYSFVLGRKGSSCLTDVLLANMFAFLLAGHETLSHTISYTLGLLALHEEEQEKIYKQITENLHTDEIPGYEKLNSFTYVLAVLYESLRLFPMVTMLVREIADDVTFSKQKSDGTIEQVPVTKDNLVILDIAALHYNPKYWTDPEKFDPTRFLGNYNKDAYLPFSGGMRACIGRRFAEVEGIAILVMLLSRYKVELKDPGKYAGLDVLERRAKLLKSEPRITTTVQEARKMK